jgi:hypothetical protein
MYKEVCMVLHMSSNLLHVYQPDTYGVFADFMESLEREETEYHYSYERRHIPDTGQACLYGKESTFWKDACIDDVTGRYPPDQLYVPDPAWKPGRYCVDFNRFLDRIAREWVDAFNERLREQDIPVQAKYTGHNSPREYNFSTDCALFTLRVRRRELEKLFARCRERRDDLSAYLQTYHASRDGYWSFCADNVDDWDAHTRLEKEAMDFERSVWQALDFLAWPEETDRDRWNDAYVEQVYDGWGNGDYYPCLYFEEESEAC